MAEQEMNEQETLKHLTDFIDAIQQLEDTRRQAKEAVQQSNVLLAKMKPLLHTMIDALPAEWKKKKKFAKLINQICSNIGNEDAE